MTRAFVAPNHLCDFQIEQVRGVQRLRRLEQSGLDLGRSCRPKQQV